MAPKRVFQSSVAAHTCQILSPLALSVHLFSRASTQVPLGVLNASFRVAQRPAPVRYCPLWASQSTHSQGFHPGPPQGFKHVCQSGRRVLGPCVVAKNKFVRPMGQSGQYLIGWTAFWEVRLSDGLVSPGTKS